MTKEVHQGINKNGGIIPFCMENRGIENNIHLAKVDSHIHRVKEQKMCCKVKIKCDDQTIKLINNYHRTLNTDYLDAVIC